MKQTEIEEFSASSVDDSYHEKAKICWAFLMAVQQTKYKVNKRADPGLACPCRDPLDFSPSSSTGLLIVDINAYEEGAIYFVELVERFQMAETSKRSGCEPFLKNLKIVDHVVENNNLGRSVNKCFALLNYLGL